MDLWLLKRMGESNMYLNISYEQDFDDLLMHLKAKYVEKIFDIDGIGKQLDFNQFSKDFFSPLTTTTSDVSVDANANVDDASIIAYYHELPKPILRLNSYYILWKELKRLYDRVTADNIIEMQLSGAIYINDFHGIGGRIALLFQLFYIWHNVKWASDDKKN